MREWYLSNKERHKITSDKWKKKNSEKCIMYAKKYRDNNKEKRLGLQRAWRSNNKEKMREYDRKYYWRDPEAARAKRHNQYWAAPEKYRKRSNDWQRAHPELNRVWSLNYWARKKAAEGSFTAEDIQNLYVLQWARCYYCTISIEEKYHIDHMTPITRSGSNWVDNLCLACPRCNLTKHTQTAEEFIEQKGFMENI